jgi:hypothetical protein
MSNARNIIGLILVAVGVCAGVYFGVWWAFIGGIIAFVEAVQATPIEAMDVGLAVARVFFAGLIGWASAFICMLPGMAMLSDGKPKRRRYGR